MNVSQDSRTTRENLGNYSGFRSASPMRSAHRPPVLNGGRVPVYALATDWSSRIAIVANASTHRHIDSDAVIDCSCRKIVTVPSDLGFAAKPRARLSPGRIRDHDSDTSRGGVP